MLIVLLILSFPFVVMAAAFVFGVLLGTGQVAHAAAQDAKAYVKSLPSAEEAQAILERAKWRGDLGPLVEPPPPAPPSPLWQHVIAWTVGLGAVVALALSLT